MLGSLLFVAALSTSTLFASDEPLILRLDAPFNELFDHALDDKYAIAGTLSFTDEGHLVTVEGVRIMLRGNTSKRESECTFPKLKIDFPEDGRPTTPLFAGLSSFKIGTHCGEARNERLTPRFGRLANQRSPIREAFVYRLLAAVGVPALEARPARISYRYTDPRKGQSPPQDRPVERNGMVIEGTDEAVGRVGGERSIGEEEFSTAEAQFKTADTVRLALAEAMIGNFDWCLKMTASDAYRCDARHPLWNIVAVALPGGGALPLMQDFDVSGMVTGRHGWFRDVFTTAFTPSSSEREIEVIAQLQRTRVLFKRAELDDARGGFVSRKAKAYEALDAADLDSEGRDIARQYLDAFYAQVEKDEVFYRQVVIAPKAQAYAGADGALLCGPLSTIPTGTPVSEPLQQADGRVQVMLLDVLWHWASSPECEAVRRGPVWIDANAIGREFPAK